MKIIIFGDGTTKEVNEESAKAIMEKSCSNAKHFMLDGELIAFSGIMRIMDADKYYMETNKSRDYSDRLAITDYKLLQAPPVLSLEKQINKSKRTREKMLNGLKEFIERTEAIGENPLRPKDLLDKMEKGGSIYAEELVRSIPYNPDIEKIRDSKERKKAREIAWIHD